ncbi:hypothetical protein K488DRAFT_43670 [Vararia minispora EC-137]|uniref:Uncharacterized protein n=1 Tax=Vararia minispora EC-137 TaxID=1314806 RepID=A0ACB8QUE0_9AGAM|nr:hypothetical protein K488DRAFT_43670 [Vararia minispora EC-137]
MTTPKAQVTTSNDLQAHLYHAFLNHSLPDVSLRVTGGSWSATYKLHRVVLIQSGFFRSLFTGGFAESSSLALNSLTPKDEIDVVFDDTNITRAGTSLAFCIARLYGGGPQLYQDPATVATPCQPLTASWPRPAPESHVPEDHHPATPRFLMSLIAAAAYLSIPSILSTALALLLRSVGPFTVVPYLSFATGNGIGLRQPSDSEPAVGLESVAISRSREQEGMSIPSATRKETSEVLAESFETISLSHSPEDANFSEEEGKKEDPADQSTYSDSEEPQNLYLRYGAMSDKIGQAATCWLARWGPDMLVYEVQVAKASGFQHPSASPSSPNSPSRPSTAPGSSSPSPLHKSSSSTSRIAVSVFTSLLPPVVPVIWRRGGLSASWIRALVSSDTLFVKGEKERYELAKTIVELRRSQGIDEEEEKEFAKMFAEGIYYSNMLVEDLVLISQDISPTTKRPYVPRSLVQAAHWSHSILRHTICHPKSSPPSSPSPNSTAQDHELGIVRSTRDLAQDIAAQDIDSEQPFWPIRTDVTERMGDTTGLEGASMDELFELDSVAVKTTSRTKRISPSEATFFGLANDRKPAGVVAASGSQDQRWTPHPPFRFAAEFWDVDALREKQRLHSHTIWYSGSLYNLYVQLVRRPGKDPQLGVYLHRQSSVDPLPPTSAPYGLPLPERGTRPRGISVSTAMTHSPSMHYSFSGLPMPPPNSRSNTPVPGSPTFSSPLTEMRHSSSSPVPAGLPATAPAVGPVQPYRDPRPQVAAYFTVACPSTTGTALTRFTSGPDVFAVSQSWGWKSSTMLRQEEFQEMEHTEAQGLCTREMSVRVTVVIGVV